MFKIDKSFIDEILTQGNAPIVRAIVAMAKGLNLSVIAEGVEEKEQLQFLQEIDCDHVQGFYFSKPLPIKLFEERYLRNNDTA